MTVEAQSSCRLRDLPRPARIAAMAMALGFVFIAVLAIVTNLRQPYQMDFVSFWAASHLTLAGNPGGVYDLALHRSVELSAVPGSGALPFPYPPSFLLVLSPLALLPYGPAASCWILATFALFVAAVRRIAGGAVWPSFSFPPALLNAVTGQNGFLTAGLFLGGLTLLPKRPFIAGLILGCLIVKPQLGLLLPFVLLAGAQWRAIAGAAVGSASLLLAGLIVYGWAPHAAWIGHAGLYASIAADGLSGWGEMVSPYASLRLAGLAPGPAWAIHLLLAIVALVTACAIWRSRTDWGAKYGALAAATALASPYLYIYDCLILIAPFAWLLRRGGNLPLLALLWCLPLLSVAQAAGLVAGPNLSPIVPAGLLLLIAFAVWRPRVARRGEEAVSPVLV